MTKRTLLLLIAFLALFGVIASACGSDDDDDAGGDDTTTAPADVEDDADVIDEDTAALAEEGEGSIWVLLPDSATSDRWEKDDRRFFTEGFEAAGLSEGDDFTIVNAEGDAAGQISQAEQAIGDGASVIVLTSNDSGSGATIIDLAHEAGVAVVEYDRFNTEGDGGDVYVSFDNVRVGATMADVLEPLIDGLGVDTPQIVMLNGGEEDNNAFLFRDGYNAVVSARVDAGDWELVDDQFTPGWDNAAGLTIFEQILVGAENNVDAVFAANDGLAGSVIAALQNAGIDPTTVPVSGQDATQAGIQNVLLGNQAMSVYKPIKAEAAAGVQAALALRAGQDVTSLTGDFSIIGINADGTPAASPTGDGVVPYIALVPIGVTADNVAETVIADGFRTLEELCTPDVAAVAAVCGADPDAAADEGSIWVLLPDSATSDRWEKDDRRFFQEGFEAAGLSEGDDFTIVNAEGDAAGQISQAEQAIGDGASVIVLTSNDSGSGATIIDLAHEAGVAVVEYDRFNTEGDGGDVYVSFDNVRVGATMADVLEPLIDGLGVDTPQIVMLNGGEEDNNAFLFRDGYNAVVSARVDAGDWELVDDQFTPGWDNAAGLTIFEQILVGAENNVDAVFAANDGLAGSVIAALQNAGIDPTTVPVSGQDATQAGIQNVLLGNQAMSVYKPIKAEAAAAVQAALALRAGQDVTSLTGDFKIIGINADGTPADGPTGDGVVPYIALVPIGVTADNVAETVIADGFRTLEELCTPDVAAVATEVCG